MAQVDFSHAILRPAENRKPLEGGAYLDLYLDTYGYRRQIVNSQGTSIADNYTMEFLEKTMNRMVVLYTGEFIESGSEFYLAYVYQTTDKLWRVSNVSFSAGDMFSFKITMELTT